MFNVLKYWHMTNYEIWQAILAEFEIVLSKANFTTWFKNTGICSYENSQATICVPTAFAKSWLEKKYHADIIKALERITNKPIKRVEYKVENLKNVLERECQTLSGTTNTVANQQEMAPVLVAGAPFGQKQCLGAKFGLNPKYVFSTFIVGKGNELAHAAAQAVVSRPGEAYNPLFIYGGGGFGKTHLLQAIGPSLLDANPNLRILFVSSEKFTNDYVSSIKEGRAKEFTKRYRSVDLFLIDDIQFIAGKEGTQEAFFHTFNELHQQNKQVVMTSDRPPKAIPALEDRLRSRFEWGMIADIAAPDLETRMAIIQKKAQEKRFDIDGNLLHLIATNVQSNIRELEGALNKIIAYHELKNTKPNESSIKQLLSSFEEQNMRRSLTPRELISQVSQYFDINVDDVLGKSREKRLAFPRQIIMFLMREELKLSYPSIGDELGGRDHTTAMHAHTKISSEIDQDLKLKQDMEMIKQRLYANSI